MADDTYNKKLESLQQYIPFLDNMIAQLKDPSKKNREQQLSKMQSLHAMITDKRKKLKLETLIKCEDVISKLYEKVHNKPISAKKSCIDLSTPASPSPPREILTPLPLTIPTERLDEHRIPKIDIYSSAGESLTRARTCQSMGIVSAKVPDMSKPPISLEDLKTLEDDVQEKIIESSLTTASLQELNSLREKLTEQIQLEDVLMKSPQKHKRDELETINTTVRNSLTLTKKVIQPPEKVKVKDSSKASPSKPAESSSTSTSPKKEHKSPISSSSSSKSTKILKEPPSIFGNILSNIDDQILEGKKKKEERRSSITGKEEKKSDKDVRKKDRKHSSSKDDTTDEKSKDAKKKERSSNSIEEKSKTKDEKRSKTKESDSKNKERHHPSGDKEKSKDQKKDTDTKEGNDEKSKIGTLSPEEERIKKESDQKLKNDEANVAKAKTESDSMVGTISVKKDLAVLKTKTEEEPKQCSFKRLADKYNPKPKKTSTEPDVDKELSDIIEEKMKTSPPKIPLINEIPLPIAPPASLLMCSQAEPEMPEPMPPVQQTILPANTTELINTLVSQLRQNNTETETRNIPLLPAPSTDNFISEYVKEDNFISEYTREDFTRDEFSPTNRMAPDFNHFPPQQQAQPMRRERLNFEPPPHIQTNQFNQMNQQNLRFMSPLSDGYNENFTQNRPFPVPQAFPQPFANFQPNQNIQKGPADMQPLDYYPPNAPIPANQYNCGPPLLSPEIPHFHNEQKPVGFGMMPNHDAFVHEDMRWRQEDTRFSWDRRDQDLRMSRDPRTYREYREMRESRDPRVINRDIRDPRTIRDPRVNRDLRDCRERDPRVSKERDFDRDKPSFRDGRSQSRDTRPSRFDSKFDRMYSRTNRDRSRSRSRSRSYSKETFTSPLDSLYSGKEEHKTGKGYGVQNFRIPKIKKEEDDKQQSTKVSSTNEDVDNVVQSVNDDSNDSTNNEVTASNIESEEAENAEHSEEATKEHEINEQKKDENEKEEVEKKVESEAVGEEPLKQIEPEETKTVEVPKPVEQEQAKPADQTILAQFFANLLSSQNKKEKKTALYSLISTFSDSFSEKELTKITKIIKAENEVDSSEEEEEEGKKTEEIPKSETPIEQDKESNEGESSMKLTKRKCRRRFRRISSTASSKDEKTQDDEADKTPIPTEVPKSEEDNVVVSVGERIKSRKRASVTPSKPKKKFKTELDMLHEDIQDMFIRDGVLTASGKRMCRMLKNDPNALTTPQTTPQETPQTTPTEPQKVRKKPGPKPKPKLNTSEMKTMKNMRVLLPKIPDTNLEQKEETPRRSLRTTNKAVYAESDDEDSSTIAEDDSLLGDDSEAESTDTEKDKTSQTSDTSNKTKTRKRRGKGWASGNIPTSKKKKKKPSLDESTDTLDTKDSPTPPADVDKSFVEPDKNYYIDFTTHKAHECRLCDYKGRFITSHYKNQHPESEVLTSRFSPSLAQEAIEDSRINLARYEELLRVSGSGKFHFTCRLCAFNTNVPPTFFYDHVTTHTGEYRHCCPMCDFSAPSGKTLKSHMSNVHNNADKRVARKSYGQTVVFAYLCGECNYVQLNQKNVEDHINIFHLQKPKIYKVNMSTVLDDNVIKMAEKEAKKDASSPSVTASEESSQEEPIASKESKADKEERPMPPPKPKFRARPAPKCVKDRLKAQAAMAAEKEECPSDGSSTAESESSTNTEPEKVGAADYSPPKRVGALSKKRLTRDLLSAEEDLIISGRSRRAAKDKAAEKLKSLMELTESGTRKKSLSSSGEEEQNKKEEPESKNDEKQTEEPKPTPEKKEEMTIVKKEIDLNVFTCKTDIQEENKKIEQERLLLMDELNKSVGSRTSLNFVDKLCNRLSNNDIIVKQEPKDDFPDNPLPSTSQDSPPVTMPVLEKNLPPQSFEPTLPKTPICSTPPPKKPILETEDMQVNANFDVTQKNDKLIMDMIQKLKGKLANISYTKCQMTEETDYDSEGPPPLRSFKELPNVKPADESAKFLLIGGSLKIIKYPNHLMFCCLVPPCIFSTENKEAFQKHCSEAHKHLDSSTLCEICGMEVTLTPEGTLLENIFKHAIEQHADFMNKEVQVEEKPFDVKPPGRLLRIRKLSGDALSITKDSEENSDNTSLSQDSIEDSNKENQMSTSVSQVTVSEVVTEEPPPETMAELELSDDNPFPFKIAGVMSLAEPPPPLAPLAKTSPQPQPLPTSQLVVKEAKLTLFELSRQRKTAKAMAKFVASVSDLYKCPHYYCLFSTNFRDFLERHLKAHKLERESLIPCVYCDMKTPWEHVPMHIDIRHAHCRFACSYCLYRGVIKEYVFLHQDQVHPENDYSVIALPQPKLSKKWTITDIKMDPKNLCEPYKCTPDCGLEFLFENEFKKHLQDVHSSNAIPCGYGNCMFKVQANKMHVHWSRIHNVSTYQCGYCKTSSNDVRNLYKHLALCHQGQQPDILIRKCAPVATPDGVFLKYGPEAFAVLRKINTIPNMSVDNKTDIPLAEPPSVPVTTPTTAVPYALPTKTMLQVVTSKAVLNRTVTLVGTNAATSTGNILFLPTVTSCNTLTNIVMSPQTSTLITSVAPIGNTPTVVPALQEAAVSPAQKDGDEPKGVEKEGRDSAIVIEPVEHITVSEDTNQSNEENEACEADPLSLETDVDMNETGNAAAESSGDESDGNKVDKAKKETKSGLMSYQLYRCAFCDISFSNAVDFKRHATYSMTCRMDSQVVKPFVCVHCGKQLKNPHVLVEHIQCHGVLRFTCSLCGNKFPTITQTRNHIKNRHNITHTSLTPLNAAKTNIDVDEYLVRPKLMLQMGAVKDPAPAEQFTSNSETENVYTPETIDKIPMRHILSSSVKCGLCSYSTKVRTNMVRHLQFHSEEKAVPDTAPVNPVPCLEKNEKMFDKMINLASSSHANTRMGGAKADPKEKEQAENYPEFIPSHCRYVCCAHGCNYICPEEGNLRHHLIALHDGETSFTCVHCKTNLTPTDADSLIKHFKLHGLQLYKCHYCSFVHNLKHKIEKHVADTHVDAPPKVITVRFMESEPKDGVLQEAQTAGAQVTASASANVPANNKSYKPWRCCMCKYKSNTQNGIQNHVLEKHEIDSQFKCALCSYKTNDMDTFAEHFKETHENQPVDIIYAYRKLEEGKEKEPETFDTTPLWQRDRPRVRHIRGILFDESSPTPAKSPKKAKSSTMATNPTPGPSGLKTTPSISSSSSSVIINDTMDLSIESVVNGTAEILQDTIPDDFFQTVNKLVKESNEDIAKAKDNMVIVIEDEDEPKLKEKDNKNAPMAKNRPAKRKVVEVPGISKISKLGASEEIIDLESSSSSSDTEQDELSERNLKLRFGGFGAPLWKQFKCPVCNMFKSKRISDFVFHLFKEMKVFRFKCKVCSDESITYRYMYKHVRDHHRGEKCKESFAALPADEHLLTWLQMVIREQSVAITKINQSKTVAPSVTESAIKCDFCPETFCNDQERNEHSVAHWVAKPYCCLMCSYSCYTYKDVKRHLASIHQDWDSLAMRVGPTVEKLLKLCDEHHEKEAEATLVSKAAASDSAALVLVDQDPVDSLSEEAPLVESDLVIVTKTDTDVPSENDVFCCDSCPFMANSEVQVLSHVADAHDHGVGFKKLNRTACEALSERVGCGLCSEVGSEVRVRQHHTERHQGEPLNMYRFQCAICPLQRRFLKFTGLKLHFNRLHRGSAVRYVSVCGEEGSDSSRPDAVKTYRCSLCPYERDLRPNGLSKLRQHLKLHFKAFTCGICHSVKYKTRSAVLSHYAKEHPEMLQSEQQIMQDAQQVENLNSTLAGIVAAATTATVVKVKNTARKSTSAPQRSGVLEEYSFYGNVPEEVDLSRIMTSVEVNGMHLNMSAEKLTKIFDLNVVVAVEDCNLSMNMAGMFDS